MCDLCYTRYNMLEFEGGTNVLVNSNIRGHMWKAKIIIIVWALIISLD